MKTVWKYDVPIDDEWQELFVPEGSSIIHTAVGPTTEKDNVSIWLQVDDQRPLEIRRFRVFGTGHAVKSEYPGYEVYFRGTAVEQQRPLVWHVFEEAPAGI